MVTTTNTHLLVPNFELLEPESLEDAVASLAAHPDARLLAGGTDLIVQMKMERFAPAHVVSIGRVASLRRLSHEDGLTLGATASIRAVATDPLVQERYTALSEACHAFSTVQTMFMGTVGGNLCNASPAADTAPALLALGATAVLRSAQGAREVLLDEFFLGPGRTVLQQGELLESVSVPERPAASGSAFLKVGRVAADISKVCAAVEVVRDGDRVASCRVALGSVAPTVVRAAGAEGLLAGETVTEGLLAEIAQALRAEISPISDVRSTAEYRSEVAGVIVVDAFKRAWARAGGGPVA